MTLIVKRKGHKEKFDERKAYASCYNAAMNCHLSKEEAEKIADKAMLDLNKWVLEYDEVTSSEIFNYLSNQLRKINKDVGFMYETHRDLS